MKSVLNKDINEPAYPVLKDHVDLKVVVLFTSKKYGLVIHSEATSIDVGDSFHDDSEFRLYKGSITLSN